MHTVLRPSGMTRHNFNPRRLNRQARYIAYRIMFRFAASSDPTCSKWLTGPTSWRVPAPGEVFLDWVTHCGHSLARYTAYTYGSSITSLLGTYKKSKYLEIAPQLQTTLTTAIPTAAFLLSQSTISPKATTHYGYHEVSLPSHFTCNCGLVARYSYPRYFQLHL